MAEDGLTILPSAWERVKRAVIKVETPGSPVLATTLTPGPLPPPVRAILCERLFGHGMALALRTRRVISHQIQEVTALRTTVHESLTNPDEAFTLRYAGVESLPINLSFSDDEFLEALLPWSLAGIAPGDVYIYGGWLLAEEVPASSIRRPAGNLPLWHWTIAFAGPRWDTDDPEPIEVVVQPGNLTSIVIAYPSSWEPYGEPIVVYEGGLLRDEYDTQPTYRSYEYQPTSYHPGTAVLCNWMPDAEGYVVYASENKEVEDYTAIWRAYLAANAWAEFEATADFSVDPVTGNNTLFRLVNSTIEQRWGYGPGWNYGFGPGSSLNRDMPHPGRPVYVRSSGELPAGLLPETLYYLLTYNFYTREFQLATTRNYTAQPIAVTSAGSGLLEIQLYGDIPPIPPTP